MSEKEREEKQDIGKSRPILLKCGILIFTKV